MGSQQQKKRRVHNEQWMRDILHSFIFLLCSYSSTIVLLFFRDSTHLVSRLCVFVICKYKINNTDDVKRETDKICYLDIKYRFLRTQKEKPFL